MIRVIQVQRARQPIQEQRVIPVIPVIRGTRVIPVLPALRQTRAQQAILERLVIPATEPQVIPVSLVPPVILDLLALTAQRQIRVPQDTLVIPAPLVLRRIPVRPDIQALLDTRGQKIRPLDLKRIVLRLKVYPVE